MIFTSQEMVRKMTFNPLVRTEKVMHLDSDSSVLLRNAQILDPEFDFPRSASLCLRGGIITSIHYGKELLHSDRIDCSSPSVDLDLEGRLVLPGLIDLHVHNTGRDRSLPFQDYFPADDGVKLLRAASGLARTLEAGFTTVRSLGHGSPEIVEQLKKAIGLGLINGPRIFTCGWAISQGGGHGNFHSWPYDWVERVKPRSAFADGPLECQKLIRRNFGLGADLIKIYVSEGLITDDRLDVPNFTLEEITTITGEAHRRNKKVAAHAFGKENVARAVEGGVDTVEHGTEASQQTLERMAEKGVVLVPTLSVFHRYEAKQGWNGEGPPLSERQAELVNEALRAGVQIGCGSDSGTHVAGENAEELFRLTEAGLSWQQAIAAATSTAAEAMGLGHCLGRIREGYLADLLVLESSVLQDIQLFQDSKKLWKVFKSQSALPVFAGN